MHRAALEAQHPVVVVWAPMQKPTLNAEKRYSWHALPFLVNNLHRCAAAVRMAAMVHHGRVQDTMGLGTVW